MDERPEIDTSGPELVYIQVADHITGRIERGDLIPGSRLPPERELATFYGVSYDTVRRATISVVSVRRVCPIPRRMWAVVVSSSPCSNMTRSNTSCAVLREANSMSAGVNNLDRSTIAAMSSSACGTAARYRSQIACLAS